MVEIEYVGELKVEGEGTRFTVPTRIAPRYGAAAPSAMSGWQASEGAIEVCEHLGSGETLMKTC